jgi:hypothetical protein
LLFLVDLKGCGMAVTSITDVIVPVLKREQKQRYNQIPIDVQRICTKTLKYLHKKYPNAAPGKKKKNPIINIY